MIKKEYGRDLLLLLILTNIAAFLLFAFHFILGRIMGPACYGILSVLMSFIYIYQIPIDTIRNIVTKYSSKFKANNEEGKTKFLLIVGIKNLFLFSIIIFLIALIPSVIFSIFLDIEFYLFFIVNLFIIFAFVSPVLQGVLQGRKEFGKLGWTYIIEATLRLVFALILVIIGWGVFGGILGVILGYLVSLIFSFYFNKKIIRLEGKHTKFTGIYFESFQYFMVIILILFFQSIDMILARRFFSPEMAGKYSALSMLGKIIFFGTISVGRSMFPYISERKAKQKGSSKMFFGTLLVVAVLSAIGTIIYFAIPSFIINMFYGSAYVEVYYLLGYIGLAFSFLALTNIVLLYGLSSERLRFSWGVLVFMIISVVLLFLGRGSLVEYVYAFLGANIITFIGSWLFIGKEKKLYR